METLKDLFYFIYVIHQNAFSTLYYFIITNVAFVALFASQFYVFNKQNMLVEKSTIRPVRRQVNPSTYYSKESNSLTDDIVMATLSKERIKLMLTYAGITIAIIACFLFATEVVLYMITLMWMVGALSVYLLKGDRKEMADKIQNYSLGYCLILIMIKFMISLVVKTPITEWSRSLGVALPASAAGTLSGYLPMMFLILTLGFPLAYFRIVAQAYSVAKDNKNVEQRRGELMRTGNQNMLHQYEEDQYKNQNRF